MLNRPVQQSFDDSSSNKYHESDIRYTLQICQWLLKPIGMWSPIYGFTTIYEKISSFILIVVCLCSLCFVLIPSSHYIFFREQDLIANVMLFAPVGFSLTSTIKYCYIGLRATTFRQCIKHVENDWRMIDDPVHRSIMLRNVAIGRYLTILSILFLFTGGISYHTVVPLLSKKTVGNVTSRVLVYPGYDVFFDETASPTYEILFSLHSFYNLTACDITVASCNLAAIFVTHACGHIQIQMHRLERLVRLYATQNQHSEDPLTTIVRQHVRILRFAQDVEAVLREIFLMELVSSTLTMCLLEYYCITEWANSDTLAIFTYGILLVSMAFNMLIFCYIGELLVDQGAKIGEACYAVEWYNLPSKKARSLILLMVMSKFPPKLTAGKIFDLSLTTFSTVAKSSVVYLNLLRTIAD